MTKLPHLNLIRRIALVRVIHLVETVHVELTNKRLPIRMLEPIGQDETREFGRIRNAETVPEDPQLMRSEMEGSSSIE